MKNLALSGVCIVVIVCVGVLQGRMSERWSKFPELTIYSAKLENVPVNFGDWKGEEADGPSELENKQAGNVGIITRNYRNTLTGAVVKISLACGRLNAVFDHRPDICYPTGNFDMDFQPREIQIQPADDGAKAEFKMTDFRPQKATIQSGPQRVYWSWSAPGGDWRTPSERLGFAGERAMYKLYVIRDITQFSRNQLNEETQEKDPCYQFIREFVPELRKVLTADAKLESARQKSESSAQSTGNAG